METAVVWKAGAQPEHTAPGAWFDALPDWRDEYFRRDDLPMPVAPMFFGGTKRFDAVTRAPAADGKLLSIMKSIEEIVMQFPTFPEATDQRFLSESLEAIQSLLAYALEPEGK